MLTSILILVLLTATPAFALSDAQDARFFEAIQAMESRSHTFYTSVDPRFELLLAPVAEDPAFRESQRCVLNKIEEEGGSDMLEDYIGAMEVQAETEITSLIDLAQGLPPVMTSDLIFTASAECGPMSNTTKQMMTPEFMKLMDEPEVMQGLIGQ